MNALLSAIPYILFVATKLLGEMMLFEAGSMKIVLIVSSSIACVVAFLGRKRKSRDYFFISLLGTYVIGAMVIALMGDRGIELLYYAPSGIYLALFLASVVPLFFGTSFTRRFADAQFPKVIRESNQYYRIHLVMGLGWAVLFAVSFIVSRGHYSDDLVNELLYKDGIPALILIGIGVPFTVFGPDFLQKHLPAKRLVFKSVADLFEAMPFGINKKRAKGVTATIQFNLTGVGGVVGYLVIENQACSFTLGEAEAPTTTINCDSELWLKISGGEVSGEEAYLNDKYEVLGDVTILLILNELFLPPGHLAPSVKSTYRAQYNYGEVPPHSIKRVVIFDGGFRSTGVSKTTFMAQQFAKGLETAGAEVEYVKLKEKDISPCTGCYSCWTKTPGECMHSDDMTELLDLYRSANLVVFASPLYIFNVTGIMKTFLDRIIPIVEPYMLLDSQGHIKHPDRFPEKGKQLMVVMSAAGFPDVHNNFNALIEQFRMWDAHNDSVSLGAEFFLPAAELLSQPIYRGRLEEVADICKKAGQDVVIKGNISTEMMEKIAHPLISQETFQSQADTFWASLDGKQSYLRKIPRISI